MASFYDLFCIPAFFVIFRETLEAAVLISVLLQYLDRKGEPALKRQVWWGAAAGGAVAAVLCFTVLMLYFVAKDTLGGYATMIVEGTMLGLASIFISYFLVTHLAPGMKSRGDWATKWERKMDALVVDEVDATKGSNGFFFLAFTSVVREGFEAAVFIVGIGAAFPASSIPLGVVAGLVVGVAFGVALFASTRELNLSTFFIVSAAFLALIAAGLAAHASYEFQKGELFGTWACRKTCDDVAPFGYLANYAPVSDVSSHMAVDLDVASASGHFKAADWAAGWAVYADGENSVKKTNADTGEVTYRTMRGFSKSLAGEAAYDKFFAFHADEKYADNYIRAALQSQVPAAAEAPAPTLWSNAVLTDKMRKQLAVKGMAYQHAWIYASHELYSALGKCEDGNTDDASGAPHAWDEGWAFWAGSLVGEDGTVGGQLGYTLADKRCGNFGTCISHTVPSWRTVDDGANSNVNAKLLRLYRVGQQAVREGRCAAASGYTDQILQQMAVPLIQGALRYAWRSDPNGGNETVTSDGETLAEYNAFAIAVVPLVHACDPTAADVIARSAAIPDGALSMSYSMPEGFANVKTAFESTYACMGVTCADVGGLLNGDTHYAGMEPCSDGSSLDDGAQVWLDLAAESAAAAECEVDDDETWLSYRRLDSRQLTTARATSCRDSGKQIAWVNREVFDIEECCSTDKPFFFLLMTLFWFRAAPTNLEVLLWCLFWPCIFIWGYAKVAQIKESNEDLKVIGKDGQVLPLEGEGDLMPKAVSPFKEPC